MKDFKKILAVLLLAVTLFNSIFFSYKIDAQAAEVVTVSYMQYLLELFGITSGLGNQADFWERAEYFQDLADSISAKSTYSFSDYGDVDFSDSDSVSDWLTWTANFDTYLTSGQPGGGGSTYTAAMVTMAKALDSASYAATGTSATTAIANNIQSLFEKFQLDADGVTGDISDFFGSVSGSDDNDDDNDPHIDWDKYLFVLGVAGSALLSKASDLADYVSDLVSPEETVYTDYADAFADVSNGYSGAYSTYINEYDTSCSGRYKVVGIEYKNSDTTSDLYYLVPIDSYIYFGIILSDNKVYCRRFESSTSSASYYAVRRSWNKESHSFYSNSGENCFCDCDSVYLPVFSSVDDAYSYFYGDGTSDLIQNLADNSAYITFRDSVASPMDTLTDALTGYFDKSPSISDVQALTAVLEAINEKLGSDEYLPAVADALDDTAGTDDDTDTTDDTTTADYTSILDKILAAILALPSSIWKLFTTVLQSILDGILDIPANVWDLFTDPISALKDGVDGISDWLSDFLTLLKEWWDSITAFFDAVLEGIEGLSPGEPDYGPVEESTDGTGGGFLDLVNCFLLLLYILFSLLRIFLHLLEFIINIFKIPADAGFITGDFKTGFDYIKSVTLEPLTISVYDFLMGLVHISIIFGVVGVLKKHIDKLHI